MTLLPPPDCQLWLAAFNRAAGDVASKVAEATTSEQRLAETGTRGAGGDDTLVIDAQAEEAVFAVLQDLHDQGQRFSAISEERGTVDFGSPDLLVVIDPIDGSTNAKRGLPGFALSIALAVGPGVASSGTMREVICGVVCELTSGATWSAISGEGAWYNGQSFVGPESERRTESGLIELVAVESARPNHLAESSEALLQNVHRIRATGAIALALCQVASGRVDAMASLWRCRSVDAAAGQLIVRESGGQVSFPGFDDELGAPLDLAPHAPVCAARSVEGLRAVETLPSPS